MTLTRSRPVAPPTSGHPKAAASAPTPVPPAIRPPPGRRAAINLAAVDLNLLSTFDWLLKTGNVSRAGEQMGRSQSAMSHALARLRRMFGDELFVRLHNRLVPTPKAVDLAHIIEPALASIRLALEAQTHFDPMHSTRQFVLGMTDVASFAVMPAVMPRIRTRAPQIDVRIIDMGTTTGIAALIAGQIELTIGLYPELPAQIRGTRIATLDNVGIADAANTHLRGGTMNFDAFLAAPHVSLSIANDPFGTDIDRHLNTRGVQRRVALQLPHCLSIPGAIRGTDLIAVVDRRVVSRMPDMEGLISFDLPFEHPDSHITLNWHERHQNDPGHRWLRELIGEATY